MFIFSNLATSLDGKIATADRKPFPLGTAEDFRMMQVLRARADVVLFGASTLRTYRKACIAEGHSLKTQPANAVMSSTLQGISPAWPFFRDPDLKRILFVGANAPKERIRKFEKSSEIILLKGSKPNAPQVVQALIRKKCARLLVEGGGAVMWDFASRNLIDEYYVTLTPRILGGTEAPTLVDGPGFSRAKVLNLRLKSVRRVKSELYLVYTRA
jgi:riboflavin-specific deaminase-like protein